MERMKPDELRAYLAALADQNGGRLTARVVVDDARRQGSKLAPHFDFDVRRASERDFLRQARHLIRRVRYQPTKTEVVTLRTPHYVHDPTETSGYLQVTELRSEADKAEAVVREEFARAEGALRRALAVAGVLGLSDEIDPLIDRIHVLTVRLNASQKAA